ncbi:MAG: NAD-dependent epimerase/dehydratase family protein [Opitutaceae bacterium]|nr:NAD-dependent epimerase/dehydratase family protein [Cytophagales bacterium]
MFHIFPEIPDFSNNTFLITGGAGFIGSHVCDFLVDAKAKKIVVFDNISTGSLHNIQHHLDKNTIEFINGDITDYDDCLKTTINVDIVIHLAALGSVPRSVANPLATHEANSTGFLNVLWAAHQNKVSKFIYASSSSVYGDNCLSPKVEGNEGFPLSPYALTKQNNEANAKLFSSLYTLQTIGLRFFNIFGPRQNSNGPYAAFLPLVISCAKNKNELKINGDGLQSRDFTYVANAVYAIKCAIIANKGISGVAFNVGCGKSSSLLEVIHLVEKISGTTITKSHQPERSGDIKNSLADLASSSLLLGYKPIYSIEDGLSITFKE